MTIDDIYYALMLPKEARVDLRVPKSLALQNSSFVAADRRRIEACVESIHWLAALRPNNVGVPEYRDVSREYVEIEVITVVLRGAKTDPERLALLLHRVVPYPVFLILEMPGTPMEITLSLAHKRFAENDWTRTVVDGDPTTISIGDSLGSENATEFLNSLALANQPRLDLRTLYQGWIDTLTALDAARITSTFIRARTPEQAESQRIALADIERLNTRIAALTSAAERERQINRRVEINLEIVQLRKELDSARNVLNSSSAKEM